jgi:hypothetical protein
MLVYIGSFAFNQYLLSEDARPHKDIDIIADYDSALRYLKENKCDYIVPIHDGKKLLGRNGKDIFEIEIAWEGTTAASFLEKMNGNAFPSLDWLYTIKMSHRYLKNNPHFQKTRGDILVMRTMGAEIADQDWYEARMAETYHYEHPDLTRTKEEFFVDQYKYDHDTIHEAVAIYDRPAYTMYQREGAKGVLCSKALFLQQPYEVQIAGVLEEASVLALERSLIPHPGKLTEQQAFDLALEKVCTSITSGWFREFAWENYGAARRLFQSRTSLLTLLQIGISKGIVKEA